MKSGKLALVISTSKPKADSPKVEKCLNPLYCTSEQSVSNPGEEDYVDSNEEHHLRTVIDYVQIPLPLLSKRRNENRKDNRPNVAR